ncbi:hypothetical protein JCM19038_2838 [Geomicrobium sp. JCM 19038]|nr:hypothetical protein JCM19038_2838 [Geomicrobium sp. JCM 19038]
MGEINLYKKLKEARVESNVSVEEIAKCIGVESYVYLEKENGNVDFLYHEVLRLRHFLKKDSYKLEQLFFNSKDG